MYFGIVSDKTKKNIKFKKNLLKFSLKKIFSSKFCYLGISSILYYFQFILDFHRSVVKCGQFLTAWYTPIMLPMPTKK